MSNLRDYFKKKALTRLRYALRGQDVSRDALNEQIEAVAKGLDFDKWDGVNAHQRQHPNPRKLVDRAIEAAVRAIRVGGGATGPVARIIRDLVDRLRRSCHEFWRFTDPNTECQLKEGVAA